MTTSADAHVSRRLAVARMAALSGLLLIFGPLAAVASAADDTLPGGTAISVDINDPADGALVADPPGGFDVSGTAAVAEGEPVKDTTLVFVMDVSESMIVSAGVDCTGDGVPDTFMTCEQEAVAIANQAAADPQSTVALVGLASFSTGGQAHDVDLGTAGTQLLVPPDLDSSGDGTPDLEEVARSFTPTGVTSYGEGLQAAIDIINDPSNTSSSNSVIFMSDGLNNTLPDVSSLTVPPETNIQSFALGDETLVDCTSDPFGRGSLADVAALSTAGTGSCEQVDDVSELAEAIEESRGSTLDSLDLTVDGGPATAIPNAEITPDLPADGPVSASFTTSVTGLDPGVHEVCVTATGTDAGGTGTVTDCIDVTVADITLTPASDTNELTAEDDEHTVTATVSAGADGGVSGTEVDFEILSGPNAGETGSATTDGAGAATFTYTATDGLAGVGTDTIEACFTDDLGNELCDTATKEWADTTPPEVACEPSHNPAGHEPQAGTNSPGQNEDGFYELTATDAVDPDPDVFVRDSGSGTVFGPFESGVTIKYTEDGSATPERKPIGGPNSAVQWHIIGNGDAEVFAEDASGNVSESVDCLVPPPPK